MSTALTSCSGCCQKFKIPGCFGMLDSRLAWNDLGLRAVTEHAAAAAGPGGCQAGSDVSTALACCSGCCQKFKIPGCFGIWRGTLPGRFKSDGPSLSMRPLQLGWSGGQRCEHSAHLLLRLLSETFKIPGCFVMLDSRLAWRCLGLRAVTEPCGRCSWPRGLVRRAAM